VFTFLDDQFSSSQYIITTSREFAKRSFGFQKDVIEDMVEGGRITHFDKYLIMVREQIESTIGLILEMRDIKVTALNAVAALFFENSSWHSDGLYISSVIAV